MTWTSNHLERRTYDAEAGLELTRGVGGAEWTPYLITKDGKPVIRFSTEKVVWTEVCDPPVDRQGRLYLGRCAYSVHGFVAAKEFKRTAQAVIADAMKAYGVGPHLSVRLDGTPVSMDVEVRFAK